MYLKAAILQMLGGDGASLAAGSQLEVYTTRPDTLFGATYMVLSPEHPLLQSLTTTGRRAEVDEYVKKAALKSDLERTELQKVKTGVYTGRPMVLSWDDDLHKDATGTKEVSGVCAGSHALNPATGKAVPIWVADYVLGSYGSGAIMAVPAHDSRDLEFATQYDLPVVRVVQSSSSEDDALPFTGLLLCPPVLLLFFLLRMP